MKTGKNKLKITRVCLVNTVYSLFLYLLYSKEDELNHTYYFFGREIARSIREKFPNHYFIYYSGKVNIVVNHFFLFFKLFIFRYIKWPFLKYSDIFCQDHLICSKFIIGKHSYTFIEDIPKAISIALLKKRNRQSFIRKIIKNILNKYISGTIGYTWANNSQCKELILSVDDNVPYIENKKKHIVPIRTTWENISQEKKEYILNIFNVSSDDITAFKQRTHLILTQPFSSDINISEDDQIQIYNNIIKKYDPSILIIKRHPRDLINYNKFFPDVFVFDKPIPMQIFLLLEELNNIKKVITITSTAIDLFPDTVEKEWVGSSVNPTLLKLQPNLVSNVYEKLS